MTGLAMTGLATAGYAMSGHAMIDIAPLVLPLMLVDAIRVCAMVAIALAAAHIARRRSAALRHWLLALGIACAAAVPLLQPIAPAWRVPAIAPWQLASAAVRAVLFGDNVTGPDQRNGWSEWQSMSPPPSSPMDAERGGSGGPRWLAFDSDTRVGGIVNASLAALSGHPGPRAARVMTVFAIVWAIGTIASVSILLVGLARLAWLAAHARRVTRGRWMEMTRDVARELGLRRSIRLLHSKHPSLLVTWGLFRPTLLLPAAAMHWSDERVHIVLRHELAHIRRHDWAMQMCADLLRCVYWFNPLLWIACARLRHESELACDDEVLRRGVECTDYATHVLDLARAYGRHRRGGAAPAAAMAHPSGLERRIRTMLTAHLDRAPVNRSVRVASAMALAMMTLPVAGLGAARDASQAPASLSGTVVDQSGAAVPSAEVRLMTASGESRAATLDASAHFTYTDLPAGEYVIDVRAMGFAPVEDHVTLSPDQRIERRVTLPLGSVEETMVFSGASPSAAPAPADQDQSEQAARAEAEQRVARYRDQPLQPPSRVKMVQPAYPDSLRSAGVHDIVVLDSRIAIDGAVTNVQVLRSSQPELAAAAREAVQQWRYAPTLLHGVPVETRMKVTIEFRP